MMIFKSDKLLYTYITTIYPEFDLSRSFRASRFSFITTDGVIHKGSNFFHMLSNLNALMGKDHFDAQNSRAKGRYTYFIHLNGEYVEPKKSADKLISLEATKAPVSTVVESESENEPELPIVEIDTSDIDWVRLEALNNTKDDKAFLADVAEKYNVTLKRNTKVESMLETFKSELGL